MESAINILIITHATFGGIALLTGLISIIAYKGKNLHKKSGKFFVYTMITSGLIAMFIAVLPNHECPFLFAIGIYCTCLDHGSNWFFDDYSSHSSYSTV